MHNNAPVQGTLASEVEEMARRYHHSAVKIEMREHVWSVVSAKDHVPVSCPHFFSTLPRSRRGHVT